MWYLYLSEPPCSHLETVCRTTFSLTASSCCESPFDFLIALIFSLSIRDSLLLFGCHPYCRLNCPLPQATHFNISRKIANFSLNYGIMGCCLSNSCVLLYHTCAFPQGDESLDGSRYFLCHRKGRTSTRCPPFPIAHYSDSRLRNSLTETPVCRRKRRLR